MYDVGDRVIGIGEVDCCVIDGLYGTVVSKYLNDTFTIEFDDPLPGGCGHSGGGVGEPYHCWNIPKENIQPESEALAPPDLTINFDEII